MKIILFVIALFFPFASVAASEEIWCETFANNSETIFYDAGTLKIQGQKLGVRSAGTGIPLGAATLPNGKAALIQYVKIFDVNTGDRGDFVYALLINDVLYRPTCKG